MRNIAREQVEHIQELSAQKRLLQYYLSSLLAIIHRDGGHYEREHGTEKAVEDAKRLLSEHYLPSVQSPALNTESPKDPELPNDISALSMQSQLAIIHETMKSKWKNPSDGEEAILRVIENVIDYFTLNTEPPGDEKHGKTVLAYTESQGYVKAIYWGSKWFLAAIIRREDNILEDVVGWKDLPPAPDENHRPTLNTEPPKHNQDVLICIAWKKGGKSWGIDHYKNGVWVIFNAFDTVYGPFGKIMGWRDLPPVPEERE